MIRAQALLGSDQTTKLLRPFCNASLKLHVPFAFNRSFAASASSSADAKRSGPISDFRARRETIRRATAKDNLWRT